ncbi:unnamed protein product [Lactuca saligna]|uniref:DUF4005 domain-containing protein n=1 Tax=Lactuca saligna TaxID=75948 RepID=A0AA36ELC9_LACSI|nr:unnamed protein product [Lactuca saligna]
MGKKRSWFGFLKRLLICKAQSTKEKGAKKSRWCFGMLKTSRHYHALETPDQAKVNDHKEEQKQHTLALTVAMTAAAEAAVAAANAAAELARLVRSPQDHEWRTRYEAAIKIQSFYRSHLARKALIGLRGVVKLQAVIRSQIVRRKFLNILKSTQRSKVHQIWVPTFDKMCKIGIDKQDLCSPRMSIRRNGNVLEDPIKSNQMYETQKKLRFRDKNHIEEQHSSPSFRSRMSNNGKRHYHLSPDRSDETSLPNSPVFPAYMATTESFMAKARSLSTPRRRISFLDHGYCTTHGSSCGMPVLSSSSSFNGGVKGNYRHMHLL